MKIVLVTGGNRGIGLEICKQLVELEHTVILGSRDLEKGKDQLSRWTYSLLKQEDWLLHQIPTQFSVIQP